MFLFEKIDLSQTPLNIAFNKDCLKALKLIPDNFFDLAIVDIPYGINVGKMAYLKEMKTSVKQKNGNRINGNRNKTPYTQKDWDSKTPPQEYFDELKRVSKHQIIFGIDYVDWKDVGTGRIIWDKMVDDRMSFNRYEVAYCSLFEHTETIQLLWSGMMQAKSLSEPTTQQGNKKMNEKRIHPTHKPILLYLKLLKDYAKTGWKILDTHLGGGSIRIACDKLNHPLVAFEIDEEYFYKQEKRYVVYKSQTSLMNDLFQL